MNKNNYQISIDRATDGKASEVLLIPGSKTEAVRLLARPGAIYTLTDKASDKAPQQIFARRQGKNLLLQIDVQRPGEAPDLILEGYYDGAPGSIVGVAEDSSTYRFIPNTAQEFDQLGLMADGAGASQVLGGSVFVGAAGAPMLVAAAPLVAAGGFALGPLGMAAAGVGAAVAIGGAGGGGGGGGQSVKPTQPSVSVDYDGDSATNTAPNTDAQGRPLTNQIRPALSGTGTPGNKINILIDGKDPQVLTIGPSGRWTWTPPVDLAPNQAHAYSITQEDSAGNKSDPVVSNFFIDTLAPEGTFYNDNSPTNWNTGDDIALVFLPASNDIFKMSVSLLGQPAIDIPYPVENYKFNPGAEKAGGLADVSPGFYTLFFTLTDKALNQTVIKQVAQIGPTRTQVTDAWDPAEGSAQIGSDQPDVFVNQVGNQTFRGKDSSDTYVFLARDAGTADNSPDRDTILDFTTGDTGARDVLNLRDLLGSAPNRSVTNLAKYVKVTQQGADTEIWISSAGAFAASTPSSALNSLSNQVIVLKEVNLSFDNLVQDEKYLLWETFGSLEAKAVPPVL